MKNIIIAITIILSLAIGGQLAMAEGSARHSSQALNHSVQASAHSVAGAAKFTSAAIAVPLLAIGGVGTISGHAGKALFEDSNKEFGSPLSISDETVTAGPTPDRAVYQQVQ